MRSIDRRPMRPTLLGMVGAAVLLVAAPASAATFFVQQTDGAPGQPVDVCVWMTGGNNEVAGVQMDLSWDPACMEPATGGNRPRCRSNPDTGKTVQSAPRGASTVRAIMLSFSDVDPIPDGELFCCQFRVTNNPPGGQCAVGFSNLIASTPTGQRTDARSGRGGGVNIGRAGGAPAPVAGGFEPAPAPAPGRPAQDDVAAAPPPAGEDARAPEPRAANDRADDPAAPAGRAEDAGTGGAGPGRAGVDAPGAEAGSAAADVAERFQPEELDPAARFAAAEAIGREADAPADSAVRQADTAAGGADDGDATPTPAPPTPAVTAAAAQVPAQPTATPPAATPTQAQPTATPTVSAGWLGGCSLMRR